MEARNNRRQEQQGTREVRRLAGAALAAIARDFGQLFGLARRQQQLGASGGERLRGDRSEGAGSASDGHAALLIEKSVAEHGDYPLVDRRKLVRELDATRRTHLAFDLGEHGQGISALGVAMLDTFGRPVAVSVPAPTHRFEAQRETLAEALSRFRSKMRTIIRR